jgi:hypothetical protein
MRRVSSGAKAQFLLGFNVGAEAPTPVATIYEMASSESPSETDGRYRNRSPWKTRRVVVFCAFACGRAICSVGVVRSRADYLQPAR